MPNLSSNNFQAEMPFDHTPASTISHVLKILHYNKMAIISSLLICLCVSKVIYNIFFHPLRSYPGPWYARGSRIWYSYRALKGTLPYDIKNLHDRYGSVVRIAPDELSYNCVNAWQEIYGRNSKPGSTVKQLFRKDPILYATFVDNQETLIDAEDDAYKNQKKPLSQGFTPKAIASSQDIISKYHMRMIQTLKEFMATHKGAIDINAWVSNCSLDISTMLTISREHSAIALKEKMHPALTTLSASIGFLYAYLQFQRFPKFITWTVNQFAFFIFGQFKMFERNNSFAPLMEDRFKNGSNRPDYMTHLLTTIENTTTPNTSLIPKALFLIIAGTETSATAILGVLFHLTANPKTYTLLSQEIRSAFKSQSEINIESTRDLKYLNACINEGLRVYTPTPGTFTRLVPKEGAVINGKFVNGDTVVGIPQFAAFRSKSNFERPDEYLPERWLNEKSTDKREAFHPFSFGPRICIARESALANIKVMIAHLVWEFDMELLVQCRDWSMQTTGVIPHRGPLLVNITSRRK